MRPANHVAVPGMSCPMPTAPVEETTSWRQRDSVYVSAFSSDDDTWNSRAARRSSPLMRPCRHGDSVKKGASSATSPTPDNVTAVVPTEPDERHTQADAVEHQSYRGTENLSEHEDEGQDNLQS